MLIRGDCVGDDGSKVFSLLHEIAEFVDSDNCPFVAQLFQAQLVQLEILDSFQRTSCLQG